MPGNPPNHNGVVVHLSSCRWRVLLGVPGEVGAAGILLAPIIDADLILHHEDYTANRFVTDNSTADCFGELFFET